MTVKLLYFIHGCSIEHIYIQIYCHNRENTNNEEIMPFMRVRVECLFICSIIYPETFTRELKSVTILKIHQI